MTSCASITLRYLKNSSQKRSYIFASEEALGIVLNLIKRETLIDWNGLCNKRIS